MTGKGLYERNIPSNGIQALLIWYFSFVSVTKLRDADASKTEPSKGDAMILEAIRQVLFEDLGFKGNNRSYYDVNNSFIDKVSYPFTGLGARVYRLNQKNACCVKGGCSLNTKTIIL